MSGSFSMDSSHQVNPSCKCGLEASTYISNREASKGRRFYTCPKWKEGNKCKFFRWADEDDISSSIKHERTSVEKKLELLQEHENKLNTLDRKSMDAINEQLQGLQEQGRRLELLCSNIANNVEAITSILKKFMLGLLIIIILMMLGLLLDPDGNFVGRKKIKS